jgi:hypothetical protein
MDEEKKLIKMASIMREELQKLQAKRWLEVLNHLVKFVNQFKDMSTESKKLGISLTHSWFAAARRCGIRATRSLDDLQYSIQQAKQFIEKTSQKLPKLSFLAEELKGLQQEFGSIDFDQDENTISVVTEPITLEDVYLGPFKIQLELNKLSDLYKDSPYYCIALDPHPAATSDDVTHPHVSNEKLCEGDGYTAIRTALAEGRLCDFFAMVNSILNTYNSMSPYISLNEWDGEPCYDCGYIMSSDNAYFCTLCEHDYCEECVSYCCCCDETLCLGCAQRCPHCEESICSYCMKECAECGSQCCRACLEDDTCPNCKQEMEIENEEQEKQISGNNESRVQIKSQADNSGIQLTS